MVDKYIDAAYYAQCCVNLMLGDTAFIEDMYKALEEDGFVDENGEWIYEGGE